jgi:hypothetical protein
MSELTRKQANLLRRQISKLYDRNYITLRTGDSTISIGDILMSKHDIQPIIDSSTFSKASTKFVEGSKVNKNITSHSGVNITTKLKGEAVLSEHFKLDEAGIAVEFTSDNQMFLKVIGLRQQSIVNFIEFRNELLNKYLSGEISSKVYVVRGLIYADKYFLQFSGTNGGTFGFNIDAEVKPINAEIEANFSLKWKREVGFDIDGSNGGVLGYRVSGVRLKRQLLPKSFQEKIVKGLSEVDVLATLSPEQKQELINKDALEVLDLTDEVIVAQGDDLS